MADDNIADTKQCKNCTRDIPVSNIDLHSIYCERNIRKCTICDEAVQFDELAKHHQEVHSYVRCPKCTVRLLGSNLASHLERECPLSARKCPYCELELPRCEMTGHENYCGSRTEPCECGAYVMYKYLKLHQESNHTFVKLDDEYDTGPPEAKPSNKNIALRASKEYNKTGPGYFPQEMKNSDRGSFSKSSQNVQQNQQRMDGERAKNEPGSYRSMPSNQKQMEASIGANRASPGYPPPNPQKSDGRSFPDNINVMQNQQMHGDRGKASVGNDGTGPGYPRHELEKFQADNKSVMEQIHANRIKNNPGSYRPMPSNQNQIETSIGNNLAGPGYPPHQPQKSDGRYYSDDRNVMPYQQKPGDRGRTPELMPHSNRNAPQNQPMNFGYSAPSTSRDECNINNYHNNKPIDTKPDHLTPLMAIKTHLENNKFRVAREQSPQEHLPMRNNEMPQMTSNVENRLPRSDNVRRGSFPSNRFQRGGYKKQPAPQPPNSTGPNPNYKGNYDPNRPHSNYEDNASSSPLSYNNYTSQDGRGDSIIALNENYNHRMQNYPNRRGRGTFQNKSNLDYEDNARGLSPSCNNYRSQDGRGGSDIESNENYNHQVQNYPGRRGRGNFKNKSNRGRGRGGRAYGCGSSFNKPPPNEDPKRDRASESALRRAQEEEKERREQNSYNVANGLPPVLSAAEKIEKLRKMSAKFNNDGEVDYSKVLNNRFWSNPVKGGTATGSAADKVYYSSPESSEDEAPRMNLSNLNPMTERELSTRVASHLRRSPVSRIARNIREVMKSHETGGAAAARISAVRGTKPIREAQPGEALLPCEFCGEIIPEDDFVIHETGCRPPWKQGGALKYGWGQSELFDKQEEEEEEEEDTPTQPADYSHVYREADIPCEFCHQLFPVTAFINHHEVCRGY